MADAQDDKLEDVAFACNKAAKGTSILVQTALCDVANKAQVRDAIARADEVASNATSSVSPVASILVNCAGITRDSRVTNIKESDWGDVLDVNLKGSFLMCQAFCETERLLPLLRGVGAETSDSRGVGLGGSIINIGSIVSKYGNVGQVNYAASKGGVVGLTRALAKEMASLSCKVADDIDRARGNYEDIAGVVPPSIRVNCIQPGFIHTPMANAVPEKILSQMTQRIALKRLGQAADVANLALFLASSERAGYITGEIMECSGMLRL